MVSGDSDTSSNINEIRQEWAKAEAQKQELKKQMLTVQMQSLSILLIIDEFMEYIWITESDLDSSLWSGYSNWKEKIRSLPFEEIDAFREKMVKTIQEVGKRKKEQEEEEQGSNSVKKDIIREIENLLKEKGITIEELKPENRDYKAAVNGCGETMEEMVAVEERIKSDIIKKSKIKYGSNFEDLTSRIEDDEENKKNWKKEVNRLKTIVDYLKNEQKKNPSQSNQDKLSEAENKLKDLENNPPLSSNDNNKGNFSSTQPSLPRILIIRSVVVLLAVGGIRFLLCKEKKVDYENGRKSFDQIKREMKNKLDTENFAYA